MRSYRNILLRTASLGASVVLLPYAAGAVTVQDLIIKVSNLINMLVPIVIALSVVAFIWGILQYVVKPADKSKAITVIVGGIIGIAVMVSLWGLVEIVQATFGIGGQPPLQPGVVFIQH
ncbi:MAG TPA: hypothetical protein VFL98_00055 [Candidatus Paceibacterota bacterium]|nr:hypothetical protein [Candidatus Paceibacterota bacterium]